MVTTFADLTEVEASRYRPVELFVRIGGAAVTATEAHTDHGVDQPVGTCEVYLSLPRPATLEIGADIEIEMGYPGYVKRVFHGFIPEDAASIEEADGYVRVTGQGWGAFLSDEDAYGAIYDGPISLKELYRSTCEARTVPTYLADDTTLVDGTTIELGGNDLIDSGQVIIDDRTSPLSFLTRAAQLFGYRVYDTPDGTNRLSRVSGLPNPQFDRGALTYDLADGDYIEATADLSIRATASTTGTVTGTMSAGGYGRLVGDPITADGYAWAEVAAFGQATGWVALHDSGMVPVVYLATPRQSIHWLTEGENAYSFGQQRSSREMRTYIDVKGARYTADDGGPVEIRSIADEVPVADELRPLGYRILRFSDQMLVTPELAEGCRNCLEIDQSALYEEHQWEQFGSPDMQPGEIAVVSSTTLGIINELRWVMHVRHDNISDGFFSTVTGWAGGGEALAAGNDCRTETVTSDVVHAGTQTISYYKDPSPDSVRDPRQTDKDTSDRRWVVDIDITVTADDYSSLRLTGKAHGTNSVGNKTAITGSAIEVWQLEDPTAAEGPTNEFRRVGSMDLPTLNEETSKRRNYASSDRYWTDFSLPLPGRLLVGAATLVVVSGSSEDDDADDFELKNLQLTYCGVGIPELPGAIG